MEEHGSCVFVSTGVDIPDQNYALRTAEGNAEEMIRNSLHFFRKEKIPFTWWLAPGSKDTVLRRVLENSGLIERCSPPAMGLSLETLTETHPLPGTLTLHVVRTPSDAREWARSSLRGFGSDLRNEERFSAFSTGIVTKPFGASFRLLTLRAEGNPAVTALLSITDRVGGIYYFSTLPAFRRRGLGLLLLRETLKEARRSGCSTVTLQASPMGFPLYKNAGFVGCGRFTVHSADPDAC
jgi:GNAT superfamily N-acetyltransferase